MSALRHVLLVDDSRDVCDVVSQGLKQGRRCRVTCAANSNAARRVLGERPPPDLAIIDAVLPGESGLSLANYASALSVPVLFLTGHLETAEQLEAAGIPYLQKPFQLDELLQRADAAIAASATLHRQTEDLLAAVRENVAMLQRKGRAALAASLSPITEPLWTVAIPVSAGTLSGEHLNRMRDWLDGRRYEPSRFVYRLTGSRPVVHVEFKVESEAVEFAQAFLGEIVADQSCAPREY